MTEYHNLAGSLWIENGRARRGLAQQRGPPRGQGVNANAKMRQREGSRVNAATEMWRGVRYGINAVA